MSRVGDGDVVRTRHDRVKYALISDIHANRPALLAVLEHIGAQRDIDATYHLGDLVGDAPWPNEVVSMNAAAAPVASM